MLDTAELFGNVPKHMTTPEDITSRRRFRCSVCKGLFFGNPCKDVYCSRECWREGWVFVAGPDLVAGGLPDPDTPLE